MNCEKSRENISAYFDNELSEVEIFELKEHINGCNSCQNIFDSYEKLSYCIKNTEEDIPNDFKVKISRKNIFTLLRGREGIASSIAAAVALIIFAGGISGDKYMAPVTVSPTETPMVKISATTEGKTKTAIPENKSKNLDTVVKDTVDSQNATENENNIEIHQDIVVHIPEQTPEPIVQKVETEIATEVESGDTSKQIVLDENTDSKSVAGSVESEILVASETCEDLPASGGGSANQLSEILSFQMPDACEFYDEGVYDYLCEKVQILKNKAENQETTEALLCEFELLKTEISNAKK